jgi:hypothetical protein
LGLDQKAIRAPVEQRLAGGNNPGGVDQLNSSTP